VGVLTGIIPQLTSVGFIAFDAGLTTAQFNTLTQYEKSEGEKILSESLLFEGMNVGYLTIMGFDSVRLCKMTQIK